MEPFKTRGYAIATTLKYCREGMFPERRKRVLDQLSPELIRWVESVKPTEWYTTERMGELMSAIERASDGDQAVAEHDLIACGRFAAQEATNTFLRLVMKVLTPSLFAKKLPALYERDNSRGKVRVDVSDEKVVGWFAETEGFPHLAPMCAGWMMFALESMGKQLSSSKITTWSVATPDVPAFSVELNWKS